MTADALPAFDLTGPLPAGMTMLEASAGTGKTYALAALVVRYIAEQDLRPSQLCVVTFTEAATAELRGRLRTRLAGAVAHLAAGGPATDDSVLTALADVPADVRDVRRQRLDDALTEFDTATISTIHGFCSRVVATGGGAAADSPITAENDDVTDLVTDEFIARFGDGTVPPVSCKKLIEAVTIRLKLPDAEMLRLPRESLAADAKATARTFDRRAGLLDEIADLIDELVRRTLERRAVLRRRTYDSLLTDARGLLQSPAGASTIAELRRRFSVVLIDEFQDTDQVQWDIFRTAFLDGDDPVSMVLVGDPKQSIYRFRSAELSAYLQARTFTRDRGGLIAGIETNWRSDADLLDALEEVFAGYHFGDPEVVFQPVKPAPTKLTPGLTGADDVALQFRCVSEGVDNTPDARVLVVDDLVAEVIRLLNSVTIADGDIQRPLRASDIGVLVRSNSDAGIYARALAAEGVPAASSSSDSVMNSEAAAQWRTLMVALDRPTSAGLARAAAIGWFIGLDAAALVALDDDQFSERIDQLQRWAHALTEGGMSRLLAALRENGLAKRVLSRSGGERDLTDLEHVVEVLQTVTGGRPTSPAAILALLDELGGTGSADDEAISSDLFERRIDRDDDTVKVITIHKAKGLEFAVVLCPTLWTQAGSRHGPAHAWVDGVRKIDTNGLAAVTSKAAALMVVDQADRVELEAESRRLLYVALTRACHRLVVWWAPAATKGEPPLASLLGAATGCDPQAVDLAVLVDRSAGHTGQVPVPDPVPSETLRPPTIPPPVLSVATALRRLDRNWRIWSFTAVKAAAEPLDAESTPGHVGAESAADAPVMGGIDELNSGGGLDDGPGGRTGDGPGDGPGGRTEDGDVGSSTALSPLQDAPAGAAFGTLVHSVLERVDFSSPDLGDELHECCAAALHYRDLPITPGALADGLVHALSAPLGGPLGPLRPIDLRLHDRLNELDFDLPLAAFDARQIAEVLLVYLPDDDLLRPWFAKAAAGGLAVDLDGMLTGSIDLVARSAVGGGGVGGEMGYWLADYKTNFLERGDYGTDALAAAMDHSGYGLQATLYLVALHRYLRWRLPDYEPDRHLVGSAYLFLRGMIPGRPADAAGGVFWWRPPTAAIEALDRLLATGVAT